MRAKKVIGILLILTSSLACSQKNNIKNLNFLIRTWKAENKNSYEIWQKKSNKLHGSSYKIKNEQKIISEKLEIKEIENDIIYKATVFNQNNGKGIPFKLKVLENSIFSFENIKHDFPKKIQYKILNEKELYVSVLGANNTGFSYKLIKQD